jgi:sugar phosphate isomerase/epimerase
MRFSFLFYEPIADLGELDRRMAALATLGYEGIELSAFHPLPYAIEEVAALARRHRLPVASMLTGWSYASEGLCLSSPSAPVRDRAVARLIDYVEQARPLDCLLVVGLMQGLRSDEPEPAVAADRIADCLGRVAAAAERRGVTLVLEPVNHLQVGFHNSAAEAAALVDRVNSAALGLMLDTFHMNIEEPSIEGSLRRFGPRARHVHLCETNGGPLGGGHLDVAGVLATLRSAGYDRWVSVKAYRGAAWDEAARSAAATLGLGRRIHEGSSRP